MLTRRQIWRRIKKRALLKDKNINPEKKVSFQNTVKIILIEIIKDKTLWYTSQDYIGFIKDLQLDIEN